MSEAAQVHELPLPNRGVLESFLAESVCTDIHLVAIPPTGGSVCGRWFGDDAAAAAKWAFQQNQKGDGLYWTVNAVREGLGKKPKKGDITAARFLHVDVDPPAEGEFDRAAALRDIAQCGAPPSFIIDSGNGLQAFWRLEFPTDAVAAVEALNLRLALKFGGDHCHNIDRLMRLPGTVNYPNARKRQKGRRARLAGIAKPDEGSIADVFELEEFLPPIAPAEAAPPPAAKLDGDERCTLADIGIRNADRLYSLVVAPPGVDRSADVYAVAHEMASQGFTDRQIAGILLNADYAISEHCLGQNDPARAAARAISKARTVLSIENPSPIRATPYECRDPKEIPQRQWVYGRQLLRGSLSVVVAPGAIGKTSLMVGTALALATGRALLGKTVWGAPKRVWLWNLEDSVDELARLIEAARLHWGIDQEDIAGRLFVDSALDGAELCIAREDKSGFRILEPVVDALADEMRARQIDVLIIDPFVSSHSVSENDNGAIDAIAKKWARLGVRTSSSIVLVHHTKKLNGAEANAEGARGASALTNAARSVIALNRMTADQATNWGFRGEECRRFFRVYDDKNNRAPPASESDWYQLTSVDLGNAGEIEHGDNIQVVEPWAPPNAFTGVTDEHLRDLQALLGTAEEPRPVCARRDPQAEDWVGQTVADLLGLDVCDRKGEDAARVKALIKQWLATGALRSTRETDTKGNDRPCVRAGIPPGEDLSPP